MYNVIYFHGLDSSLSNEKRIILNRYGKVTAHTYDYRQANVLNDLNDSIDEINIESTVLIGSSFGGYLANLYSSYYDIPCLLFNPALAYRSIDLAIEKPGRPFIKSLSYIVLGKNDEIIKADANLSFIAANLPGPIKITIEENMGHRVPLNIFAEHTELFFKELKKLIPAPA